MMFDMLKCIWSLFPDEIRTILCACFLFFIYTLSNKMLAVRYGIHASPYFATLFDEKYKENPHRTFVFGIVASHAFLAALLISFYLMQPFRQFNTIFSNSKFVIYSLIIYIISIIANMTYANIKLGLPLVDKQYWKTLAADISRDAHADIERKRRKKEEKIIQNIERKIKKKEDDLLL